MSEGDELRARIHDLNNALTQILTAAELIESEVSNGTQAARDARTIREAALSGRDIVAEISDRLARPGNPR